ncbi:MAG: tetratricopeptide repeat protein [Anaerolineales bacterium]|nr:tetratricopeptide repeat protein [Anaerolineales bacterium]
MFKTWSFWKTFFTSYIAFVAGIWGFVEAYTYFENDSLKNMLGSYWWVVYYLVPLIIALFIAVLRNKSESLVGETQRQKYISISPDNPLRIELFGREKENATICEFLQKPGIPAIVVCGISGMGKSALASEIFNEAINMSFEVPIWLSAGNQTFNKLDVLKAIGLSLELSLERKPNEDAPDVLKILREKKCLLVIDGFNSVAKEDVILFLNKFPGSSKVLITSRNSTIVSQDEDSGSKFLNANYVTLEKLDETSGIEFIKNVLEGNQNLSFDKESVEIKSSELYQKAKGNPGVIKLGLDTVESLEMAIELIQEGEFDFFDRIFSHSWKKLSRSAKRTLMIMTLFATQVEKEAIIKTLRVKSAEKELIELRRLFLIERLEVDTIKNNKNKDKVTKLNYRIHPLTRKFAEKKFEALSHFFLRRKSKILFVNYYASKIHALLGETVEEATRENRKNYRIVFLEMDNILAALEIAVKINARKKIRNIIIPLLSPLFDDGRHNQRIELAKKAMPKIKDPDDLFWLRDAIISSLFETCDLKEANNKEEIQAQIDLMRNQAKSPKVKAVPYVEWYQVRLYDQIGDYDKAIKLANDSLEIDPSDRARCELYCSLGDVLVHKYKLYNDINYLKQAKELYNKRIKLSKKFKTKDSDLVPWGYNRLGRCYLKMKNWELARKNFHTAIKKAEEINEKLTQAHALRGLGLVEWREGKYYEAGKWLLKSIDMFTHTGSSVMIKRVETDKEILKSLIDKEASHRLM